MAMPLKPRPEGLPQPHTQWVAEVRDRVNIAKAEIDRGEGLDGETVVNGILDRFRQAKERQY
jgi:antitoxin ParD1/3/4